MKLKEKGMTEENLKYLIDKYYNGTASDEEELLLKEFFNGNDIPEGYEEEKSLFRFYSASGEIPEPSPDFEDRLLKRIDKEDRRTPEFSFRRYLLPALSAAAVVILLIGTFFVLRNNNEEYDTYKDPKMAYAATISVLNHISQQMNRRTVALEPVAKMNRTAKRSINKVSRSVRTADKSIGTINRMLNVSDEEKITKK